MCKETLLLYEIFYEIWNSYGFWIIFFLLHKEKKEIKKIFLLKMF